MHVRRRLWHQVVQLEYLEESRPNSPNQPQRKAGGATVHGSLAIDDSLMQAPETPMAMDTSVLSNDSFVRVVSPDLEIEDEQEAATAEAGPSQPAATSTPAH